MGTDVDGNGWPLPARPRQYSDRIIEAMAAAALLHDAIEDGSPTDAARKAVGHFGTEVGRMERSRWNLRGSGPNSRMSQQ